MKVQIISTEEEKRIKIGHWIRDISDTNSEFSETKSISNLSDADGSLSESSIQSFPMDPINKRALTSGDHSSVCIKRTITINDDPKEYKMEYVGASFCSEHLDSNVFRLTLKDGEELVLKITGSNWYDPGNSIPELDVYNRIPFFDNSIKIKELFELIVGIKAPAFLKSIVEDLNREANSILY